MIVIKYYNIIRMKQNSKYNEIDHHTRLDVEGLKIESNKI